MDYKHAWESTLHVFSDCTGTHGAKEVIDYMKALEEADRRD